MAWIASRHRHRSGSTYEQSVIPYKDIYGNTIASSFAGLAATGNLSTASATTNWRDAVLPTPKSGPTSPMPERRLACHVLDHRDCVASGPISVRRRQGRHGTMIRASVASGGWTTKTTPSVTCNTAERLLLLPAGRRQRADKIAGTGRLRHQLDRHQPGRL